MTDVTVIILTRDEAAHIRRAIASVAGFASRIIVVDSGSTDDTRALASAAGAEVLMHGWTTHAAQFNWALQQIAGQDGWVLRLDADEVATPALAAAIAKGLPDVAGLRLRRHIWFQGEPVRFGGVGALPVLRLFRNGAGRAEARRMDEHITVTGPVADLDAAIIDDNCNPLDWWIAKHTRYASCEAADMLERRLGLAGTAGHGKRWIRDAVYPRLPSGARAGLYFLYRYVLRGGFRDTAQARRFHVLQGFWYRYLVDAKLAAVERCMRQTGASAEDAALAVLGIAIGPRAQV